MRERLRWMIPLTLAVCLAGGCGPGESNRNLRQNAAEATRNAKQASQEAVQDARQAAATAESKVNDIADGVQEGLRGGGAPGSPLNLNTASESEIAALPGMTREEASRIVANRPYRGSQDLLRKRLVPKSEYARISSRVTVR